MQQMHSHLCRTQSARLSTRAIKSISAAISPFVRRETVAALSRTGAAPHKLRNNIGHERFYRLPVAWKNFSPSKKVYEKIIFANYCIGGVRIRAGGCFYWRRNKSTTHMTQQAIKCTRYASAVERM
jgi:hypothetical protein